MADPVDAEAAEAGELMDGEPSHGGITAGAECPVYYMAGKAVLRQPRQRVPSWREVPCAPLGWGGQRQWHHCDGRVSGGPLGRRAGSDETTGGARRAAQPHGWVVASLPLAGGGDRRVVWPRGWVAAALVAAAEDDASLSLVVGRRRSSCWP